MKKRLEGVAIPKQSKKVLMPVRVKKAKKLLEKLSHDFVRRRDSLNQEEIKGYCFDCGKLVERQQAQAGHWQPSGSCGALLRYHPHNMHLQAGGCNCGYQQEQVKIRYTMAMIKKYGQAHTEFLLSLKNRTIKADIIFYEKMIELYEKGAEEDIVYYLNNL
jgi:hypothetical protein